MSERIYVATDVPSRRVRQLAADLARVARAVGRFLAVLVLAPLELAAAWLGLPPVAWTIRQHRNPSSTAEPEPVELIGVVIPKESK